MAVKVSILDLTVDQVEAIELAVGRPVDQWDQLPSRMALYRQVYAAATGDDDVTVRAMTLRELTASVSMGDEDADTENPTAPDQSSG